MDLVGCVCVPDDELAVLRGGDEMPAVCRPVHGVDLGQMALEGALRLHGEARQSLNTVSCDIADCARRISNGQSESCMRNTGDGSTYGLCQQARPSCALSCP